MVRPYYRKPDKYFCCIKCKDRNWIVQCSCGFCELTFSKRDDRYRDRSYICGHGGTKSYTSINHDGYIIMKVSKKGYRVAQRVLFEQYYNCCLLSWGHVHHINGIKTDNRIENLEGIMNTKHSQLHEKDRKRVNGRYTSIKD